MAKELDIPNAHLLNMVVDEKAQSDIFKAILAQDINICISRVNAEMKIKCDHADIEFYRSMLRLIRRVAESEELKFSKNTDSLQSEDSSIH